MKEEDINTLWKKKMIEVNQKKVAWFDKGEWKTTATARQVEREVEEAIQKWKEG